MISYFRFGLEQFDRYILFMRFTSKPEMAPRSKLSKRWSLTTEETVKDSQKFRLSWAVL